MSEANGRRQPAGESDGAQKADGEHTQTSAPETSHRPADAGRSPKGALLGVDFGLRRIGLAVCDPDRIVASPLGTHENGSANDTFFRNCFAQNRFVGIVVGLPLHANGDESDMSQRARQFAKWLADLSGLPFVMWDERYSSSAAESVLSEAKVHWKKRKGKVDRIAAQMILQSYIDSGCPAVGEPNCG